MSRKGVGSVGQDGLVACLFDDGDDGHDNNGDDDDCTTLLVLTYWLLTVLLTFYYSLRSYAISTQARAPPL